jgi:hypothetical protein
MGGKGGWLFVLGLFFIALMIGMLMGLSNEAGFSQAALTALFAFIGGVLMVVPAKQMGGTNSDATAGKSGIGLMCLSFGMILGVWAGIAIRVAKPSWKLG